MFTDDDGQPIREQTFGRAWHTARKAAGVAPWAKGPHHLRHHFASLLIAATPTSRWCRQQRVVREFGKYPCLYAA